MSYQRVLVALDGSKLSELALRHVVQIAAPGADIFVLSVIADNATNEIASLASAQASQPPDAAEQWPKVKGPNNPREVDAREHYLQRVSEWLEPAGYRVTVEAVQGEVIETILTFARRGFEAIVMATHGRSGMNKAVLGSVAEAVLRDAPCPVVIIPPGAADHAPDTDTTTNR